MTESKLHSDCVFYDSETKSWTISKRRKRRWESCKKCEHKNSCTVFEHANNFFCQPSLAVEQEAI